MIARRPSGIVGSSKPASASSSFEARVVGQHVLAAAVEPDDPRRPLEGAEHHDDAAVLAHVGDRLGAAPDVVEVGDTTRAEHAQRAARALRRDVDVAVPGERGAADEEHRLAGDPGAQLVVDLVVGARHGWRNGSGAAARGERASC
jgi:hypothetical protein